MKVSNNYNVINSIPVANINKKENNIVKRNVNAQNPSFGGVVTTLGNFNKGIIHLIEKGGFFAEFCLMDMCGLVLPRVYQGFNRNKEELGHLNYQAGTEEFLREFITGPSMFLIPIGAVVLAGKLLGKGTQINFKLLSKFSETFKKLGSKIAKSDVVQNQKDFAAKLYDDIIVNAKDKIANPHKNVLDFKNDFVNQLTDSLGKKLSRNENKKRQNNFRNLVANINAAFFKKENTHEICGHDATDLFDYARKYMEDIVHSTKLSLDELPNKGLNADVNPIIDKITKIRHNGRELLCLGGTLALAAFLSIIPKIYQISKKNPALNGLEDNVKEDKKC